MKTSIGKLPTKNKSFLPKICNAEQLASQPPLVECIHVSQTQLDRLNHLKEQLGPKRSRRGLRANPHFILFKLHAGRIIKYGQHHTMQGTLGAEMPEYGYDKALGEKQISRLNKNLRALSLLDFEKQGKIYSYNLTDLGSLVYWYIVKGNQGRIHVLASPEKEADQKCPVTSTKNVRCIYKDSFIKTEINTYIDKDVCKLNDSYEEYEGIKSQAPPKPKLKSKSKPATHIDIEKLKSSEPEIRKQEIGRACQARELSETDTQYAIQAMQEAQGIVDPGRYLAAMLNGLKAKTWNKVALKSQQPTKDLIDYSKLTEEELTQVVRQKATPILNKQGVVYPSPNYQLADAEWYTQERERIKAREQEILTQVRNELLSANIN